MKAPPRWTEQQLTEEAVKARALFRHERLSEPLERWKVAFDAHSEQFKRLFDEYGVASPALVSSAKLSEIFRQNLGDALRYLSGPPISADDLKVLADAESLAPARIAADQESAQRILSTILLAIDPRRFPWIAEHRDPIAEEKAAAVLASAALLTAQRISADRRNESKRVQEETVKRYLIEMGFAEASSRRIRTLGDAPLEGQFCAECLVGSRKADVPVRLFDGRLMLIECKVSNSSTNSVKRINNDAAVKARVWREEFGRNQVVPTAVLSGVFKVHNLLQAQDSGLALFWAHNLGQLRAFVDTTRS